MYEQYWGLDRSPFDPRHLPEEALRSTPYEEAVARLLYIVERERPGGLLLGCAGSGKTTVLKYLRRNIPRVNRRLAHVNLAGIEATELLALFCDELCLHVTGQKTPANLRQTLRDFLAGSVHQASSIVICCDDVDQADPEVLRNLAWFNRTADIASARVTYLLAANRENARSVPEEIFNLCELRVDLEPWSDQQASEYITIAMRAAGAREKIFTPEASQRMNELANGLPGPLARLAELALLVAASEDRSRIGTQTVESVFGELYPASVAFS